jgi:glutamate-1-semialdehyde 2,1-aminomutase
MDGSGRGGVTASERAGAIGGLYEQERTRFVQRTRASREFAKRAGNVLAGAVTSSFHQSEPWPVYIDRGEGARIWDIDGNEYVDFHNGFSAMIQGHAHPAIVEAVRERAKLGTHFGATTEHSVAVAEELTRRFGLSFWRFTNSGTESNMAAIKLARAATGREPLVRMTGSYHGHADFPAREVAFNDAAALELAVEEANPAAVLMEGAMTAGGLHVPEPGYLADVREITRRHGVVLIFDEVKTGLTIAAGGATERLGGEPDIVTLAKSLTGGLPTGAVGMTPEFEDLLVRREVRLMGTYNGNPLSMAAATASLRQVLTPAAYDELERLGSRMAAGVDRASDAAGIPGSVVALGSKGCVRWTDDPELWQLAWMWLMNRGVYTTAGRGQEWNVNVAHEEGDVDRYVDAFGALLAELTPRLSGSARA